MMLLILSILCTAASVVMVLLTAFANGMGHADAPSAPGIPYYWPGVSIPAGLAFLFWAGWWFGW